jgi:hypothetical protein
MYNKTFHFSDIKVVFNHKTPSFFLALFFMGILTYIVSMLLLHFHTGGDQIGYRALYAELANSEINEIIPLAYINVGGGEPVSVFILWIGAILGIDKDIYISLLNVLLVALLFLTAYRNKVSTSMTVLLLLNFYIIVLMVSAERLKISYIFLLLAVNVKGNAKIFFLFTAIFAHFQTIILLLSFLVGKILKVNYKKFSTRKIFFLFCSFPILFYLFNTFFQGMFYKFTTYKSNFPISEFFSIFLLIGSSILLVKEKLKFLIMLVPIFFSIYYLGGTRINMIAVTFVLYYLIEQKQISSIVNYPLMSYFVIKAFLYINLIVKYGDGFL